MFIKTGINNSIRKNDFGKILNVLSVLHTTLKLNFTYETNPLILEVFCVIIQIFLHMKRAFTQAFTKVNVPKTFGIVM